MANLKLSDDTFGILLPFVTDRQITDIRWDGNNLWIDDLAKGRYLSEVKLDDSFIKKFTQRVSDLANTNFNNSSPVLEGETDNLRIAALHESVTNTGTTITIRKTEPECRLDEENIVSEGYCSLQTLEVLKALIKARCSLIVTGDTGVGKTELIKFLMNYISDSITTLTVEDNYELRAKALRPGFDCTEIKVTDRFTPSQAIKAALRQDTKWLILSEARGTEASALLESASTGCSIATSVHSFDVRNLPDRFEEMISNAQNDIKNKVYSYFDVGILIVKEETPSGIKRYINQLCFFDRKNGKNQCSMIIDNREWVGNILPYKLEKKFNLYNVSIPNCLQKESAGEEDV